MFVIVADGFKVFNGFKIVEFQPKFSTIECLMQVYLFYYKVDAEKTCDDILKSVGLDNITLQILPVSEVKFPE